MPELNEAGGTEAQIASMSRSVVTSRAAHAALKEMGMAPTKGAKRGR
ncbi:hypothetical protein HNP55_001698 [Paucibacter oligotrophus]|uniref:Uncharacterized protein n=1 Tax=Roseateles oligotrophus TaxID=1769250 RepID=A0A840LAM6_9BURK|nr:hypothetical protein [Roseateles oligotrophus]MBB4843179.1 hypothetical protein [Roseateles oligotrophus]